MLAILFDTPGPGPQNVDLTTAKEVTFGYSVMFEHGFHFNEGGKPPGLCESLSSLYAIVAHKESYVPKTVETTTRSRLCRPAAAMTSTAGHRDQCGAQEVQARCTPPYRPASQRIRPCVMYRPYSKGNPTYGTSVGRLFFLPAR